MECPAQILKIRKPVAEKLGQQNGLVGHPLSLRILDLDLEWSCQQHVTGLRPIGKEVTTCIELARGKFLKLDPRIMFEGLRERFTANYDTRRRGPAWDTFVVGETMLI